MYLQSVSMTQYSVGSEPTGNLYFHDQSGMNISIPLRGEDARAFQRLAFSILEREKKGVAQSIADIKTPELLDYKPGSPIINDETPF